MGQGYFDELNTMAYTSSLRAAASEGREGTVIGFIVVDTSRVQTWYSDHCIVKTHVRVGMHLKLE